MVEFLNVLNVDVSKLRSMLKKYNSTTFHLFREIDTTGKNLGQLEAEDAYMNEYDTFH